MNRLSLNLINNPTYEQTAGSTVRGGLKKTGSIGTFVNSVKSFASKSGGLSARSHSDAPVTAVEGKNNSNKKKNIEDLIVNINKIKDEDIDLDKEE